MGVPIATNSMSGDSGPLNLRLCSAFNVLFLKEKKVKITIFLNFSECEFCSGYEIVIPHTAQSVKKTAFSALHV